MLSEWLIKHGYPVTDSSEDEEIEEHTGFKPGDVVFDKFRKRTGTCTITYLRLVDPHELQPGAWRKTNIVYRDKENIELLPSLTSSKSCTKHPKTVQYQLNPPPSHTRSRGQPHAHVHRAKQKPSND